jgi:hypothetical protein
MKVNSAAREDKMLREGGEPKQILVTAEVDAVLRPAVSREEQWVQDAIAAINAQMLARGYAVRPTPSNVIAGQTVAFGTVYLCLGNETPGDVGEAVLSSAADAGFDVIDLMAEEVA